MRTTIYRAADTGHTRTVYATNFGKSYTFTREKQGGRQLNFDTPIRFETDNEWQAAIDRGLGTHATSLVTRARAHLGSYVSLIEKEYGAVDGKETPDAQKAKCEAIKKAQEALKELYGEESKVDPADIHNGPLQEQMFKHHVQDILINLRKDLVACDREAGSAMLGRADHVVVYALDQVAKFNWPFAKDSPDAVEKNTRRRKISEQDQFKMPNGGTYIARHEFPGGLSDISRDLLVNALIQHNKPEFGKELEFDRSEFKNLGQTRGPLTNFFLRMPYQWITRAEIKPDSTNNLQTFAETREEKAASEAHAQWIATNRLTDPNINTQWVGTPHPLMFVNSKLHETINEAMKSLPQSNNTNNTRKRILWHLLQQGKITLSNLRDKQKANLAEMLAPLYQLDDLTKRPLPLILPESTQGNLFARGGILGATYQIVDPIIAVVENMGKNDPVMGSIALMIWAAGGVYVGGIAAAKGAHMVGGELFKTLSAAMDKVPGLRELTHSVYSGVMPLTAQAGPGHVALAQMVDGFVMGHLAYQAMTGKAVIDQDPHSINGKMAHLIMSNPVEAAVMGAICYGVGLGTVHVLGDTNAVGSWTIFDDASGAVKPMVFMADIFFAMRAAIASRNPTFIENSNDKVAPFIADMFVALPCFNSMSADEKTALKTKATEALNRAPIGGEYAALENVLDNTTQPQSTATAVETWIKEARAALCSWLPGQAIRNQTNFNTLMETETLPLVLTNPNANNSIQEKAWEALQTAEAGSEYKVLTEIIESAPEGSIGYKELIQKKLDVYFHKQAELANAVKTEISELMDVNTQKNLFTQFFDVSDQKVFTTLLPYGQDPSGKLLGHDTENRDDLIAFLKSRYPDCVDAYGYCKDPKAAAQWEAGLTTALQQLYREDLLITRETNPRVWTVLKQYPALLSTLSGSTVDALELTPAVPQPPASWQASLLPTIGRAIHGIVLGGTVGLGMYASSRLFNTDFGEKQRQWSGFNNLRGVLEGAPYLLGLMVRPLSTLNETLMLARARTLDKALTLPKNLKSAPGWLASIVGAAFFVAVDAVISPLSLVYNLGAKLGSWLGGANPSKPMWKDVGYKLPLIGFIAEAVNEPSFEDRAARRLIQNNADKNNAMGLARSATTGRAGDIAMYRQSHEVVQLKTPPADYPNTKTIDTNKLTKITELYDQSKSFASNASHIMRKGALFLDQITDKSTKKLPEEADFLKFLTFVFPEEAQKLEKQYDLEHSRTMGKDEHQQSQNQAVMFALESLLKAEITASKDEHQQSQNQAEMVALESLLNAVITASTGSKTHDAFSNKHREIESNHSTTLMIAAFANPQAETGEALMMSDTPYDTADTDATETANATETADATETAGATEDDLHKFTP